ncbi:hypothetical protein KKH24_02000, partial [Patescibacteria group bacterium]|nr:hypothetical protein [Patescibacteria group bacterium]
MEITTFLLNIVQTIISIISWPFKKIQNIMEIKNIKITQEAKHLQDVKGMDVNLRNGEKILMKNVSIEQKAETLLNTTGMKVDIVGKQEAELENIDIQSPI